MNLLQYSYTFGDDFDMEVIRNRIAAKRQLLDNYPGLHWKAWLVTEPTREMRQPKSYAPLYLFSETDSVVSFLAGPLYQGVTNAFGWTHPFYGPASADTAITIASARSCSLRVSSLHTHADLSLHTNVDMLYELERGGRSAPSIVACVQMLDVSRMQVRTYTFYDDDHTDIPPSNVTQIYDVVAFSASGGGAS